MKQRLSHFFSSSLTHNLTTKHHSYKRKLFTALTLTTLTTCCTYYYYYHSHIHIPFSLFDTVYSDEPSSSSSSSSSLNPNTGRKADRTKKMTYYSGKCSVDAIDDMKIIAGNGNIDLAEEVSELLGVKLCKANVSKFSDGETSIQILENIRARRASARQITAVIPYYSYSRSDKKMTSRVPIAAADVAKMIEEMGCDNVITIDLHAGQIQGFFPPHVPVENLEAVSIGAIYFADNQKLRSPVVVSPDAGGVPRAKKFREVLADLGYADSDFAFLIESRQADQSGHLTAHDVDKQIDLVGDVKSRDVIIVEDIIDTGSTLERAVNKLRQEGANKKIFAFSTHAILSDIQRIKQTPIDQIVVTNTIKMSDEAASVPNIKQLSIAPLLSEAIKRVYEHKSLGKLFELPSKAAHLSQAELEQEKAKPHPHTHHKHDD